MGWIWPTITGFSLDGRAGGWGRVGKISGTQVSATHPSPPCAILISSTSLLAVFHLPPLQQVAAITLPYPFSLLTPSKHCLPQICSPISLWHWLPPPSPSPTRGKQRLAAPAKSSTHPTALKCCQPILCCLAILRKRWTWALIKLRNLSGLLGFFPASALKLAKNSLADAFYQAYHSYSQLIYSDDAGLPWISQVRACILVHFL